MDKRLEVLGCTGIGCVICAYFLGSFGYIMIDGLSHALLNLIGGGMLIYYGHRIKSLTNIAANCIWAAIAVYNLVRLLL